MNKSTKVIVHIKQMKDENGNIIRTEQGNIKKCEQYFSKLLNEENERLIRLVPVPTTNFLYPIRISSSICPSLVRPNRLEKAYDRVPRQEVWRCMRKRGVTEKYVRMIQDTRFKNVTTKVRCTLGMTDGFEVKVGLHQGSALSPILFNVVMDVMTEEVHEEPPCMPMTSCCWRRRSRSYRGRWKDGELHWRVEG
ncbi:uncharacterized protein LOC125033215 [Penaeus chinensis]|uniref:uncharacterized protein LOC125033215 n=1 Tax=Penaeus chinensis TaxID=139456 RepID=UPI001FB82116|nr:uncharacterized protein LOC125033215 [Penaeus chinensis]